MKFCRMLRPDPLVFLILIFALSRVISAEEISTYSFKTDGDRYKEYCWLNGSGDRYGRWTFADLNKKELKNKIKKIKITLLVVRVNKNGRETETSTDILVSVGRIKNKTYVGTGIREGIQEEENWDYSIVRNLRKRVKSGVPFTIKIGNSSLPKDGNLAVKIVRSGGRKKPWIGIKKGSVIIVY